jgi:type I restriction enzyme, S subunit
VRHRNQGNRLARSAFQHLGDRHHPDLGGSFSTRQRHGGRFIAEENKALPANLEPNPALAIRRGDVLVSRANTRELVGSVAVASDDFDRLLLCDKLYRLRTDDTRCKPEFLALYLSASAARSVIEAAASGASTSMLNIGQGAIASMQIALPPIVEQRAMLSFLAAETAKIDALVEEQKRLIELLKEKRQAVKSQAVTKGLDPNLPMKDSGLAWLGQVPAHWELGGLTRFIGPVVDYRGRTPTKVDDGGEFAPRRASHRPHLRRRHRQDRRPGRRDGRSPACYAEPC